MQLPHNSLKYTIIWPMTFDPAPAKIMISLGGTKRHPRASFRVRRQGISAIKAQLV